VWRHRLERAQSSPAAAAIWSRALGKEIRYTGHANFDGAAAEDGHTELACV
jgi:hypothetical protein